MKNIELLLKMVSFVMCVIFTVVGVNMIINPPDKDITITLLELSFSLFVAGYMYVRVVQYIPQPKQDLLSILKTNGTGQISGICRANNREIDCLQKFFDSNDSDDEILLDFSLADHNLGSYVFFYECGDLNQQGHSEISYGKLRLLTKDEKEFYVNVEIKHSYGLDFEKFYATLIPNLK